MKTCKKCNLSFDDDKKFCKKCGDPLISENQIDPKNIGKKTVFEDRLKIDPLNLELLYEYAQFLFNNLIFKETITVSYKILAINENDGTARELLYKSYLKLDMLLDASEFGKQLLTERPTDILLLAELAKISRKLGNYDKAIEYHDKVLSLQPSNATALHNKALILLKKNQLEKAIEIFKRLYQDGQKDRITTIYAGIDKALSTDYNAAINLFVPILSNENINQKDLDNNRGFLYLGYSLSQSSANILEVSQWFTKIDFTVLKQDHHPLDEQTVVKIVEFVVNHSLIEVYPSSTSNNQFISFTESFLPKGYFTANSNSKIADIWYAIGNKQVELKRFADAINSFQKASDLCPNESKYKEKFAEIKKVYEADTRKKNRKANIGIAAIIVSLVIIAISIFTYKNFEEKKAYAFAKQLNTFNSYQTYLDKYPKGSYLYETTEAQEDALWDEAKGSKSVERYRNYLSFYPKGKYSTEANEKIWANYLSCVLVLGGTFQMGNNDVNNEQPVHSVTLRDFHIGRYEVTQRQWEDIMGNNPSYFGGYNLPINMVSWNDVQKFLLKLNSLTGENYRLPTEAEWEYAARGGKKSKGYIYAGSNNLDDVGRYIDNSFKNKIIPGSSYNHTTYKVGSKQPNELGLYDLSGNVCEWCSDSYDKYSSNAQSNPFGPSSGFGKVIRGGSWRSNSQNCRISYRENLRPDQGYDYVGFRVVLSAN